MLSTPPTHLVVPARLAPPPAPLLWVGCVRIGVPLGERRRRYAQRSPSLPASSSTATPATPGLLGGLDSRAHLLGSAVTAGALANAAGPSAAERLPGGSVEPSGLRRGPLLGRPRSALVPLTGGMERRRPDARLRAVDHAQDSHLLSELLRGLLHAPRRGGAAATPRRRRRGRRWQKRLAEQNADFLSEGERLLGVRAPLLALVGRCPDLAFAARCKKRCQQRVCTEEQTVKPAGGVWCDARGR